MSFSTKHFKLLGFDCDFSQRDFRLQGPLSEGFEVTYLPVGMSGCIDPNDLEDALRPETWLVSIMHVNNETGVEQPVSQIAEVLEGHAAYFHCDAAQGFGKVLSPLKNHRIDLITLSGHKIYSPQGIGALIARRRGFRRAPLQPLFVGGGQERGIRPGKLPVHLIAALGEAAERCHIEAEQRRAKCVATREKAVAALQPLSPRFSGDQQHVLPHVLNLAFGDMDSEAVMLALKDLVAISNGSACTTSSYTPSHVLQAMGYSEEEANACVRISWSHLTPEVDWGAVAQRIKTML